MGGICFGFRLTQYLDVAMSTHLLNGSVCIFFFISRMGQINLLAETGTGQID